jgi:hypothetical protein
LPSEATLAHREQVVLPALHFSEPPATILVQVVEATPFVLRDQESADDKGAPEGNSDNTAPEGGRSPPYTFLLLILLLFLALEWRP